jgi:hypothetical protein
MRTTIQVLSPRITLCAPHCLWPETTPVDMIIASLAAAGSPIHMEGTSVLKRNRALSLYSQLRHQRTSRSAAPLITIAGLLVLFELLRTIRVTQATSGTTQQTEEGSTDWLTDTLQCGNVRVQHQRADTGHDPPPFHSTYFSKIQLYVIFPSPSRSSKLPFSISLPTKLTEAFLPCLPIPATKRPNHHILPCRNSLLQELFFS